MNIWLLKTGEPLPLFVDVNLMRTGRLAKFLASDKRNHVTWWTSNYSHQTKSHISDKTCIKKITPNYHINIIKSIGYKKNISVFRLINHMQLGIKFFVKSIFAEKPDIIISSFPTIEFTFFGYLYCKIYNIPIIIDVRDKWPHIFYLNRVGPVKNIIKILCLPYYFLSYLAFKECNNITAVSIGYYKWTLKYFHLFNFTNDKIPIEIGFNQYLSRKKLVSIKKDVIRFWFFGTLGFTYDLATVIDALNLLPANIKNKVELIISGEGENLIKLKKISTDISIEFTGWLGQNQKNEYGKKVDVGILAYSNNAPQGLPNKVFDYMSFNLPVLSSLEGECKQFIKKHDIGWHYTAENKESLAKVVKGLFKNNFKDYFSKNRNVFESRKKYCDKHINNKWVNLINQTTGKCNGKR